MNAHDDLNQLALDYLYGLLDGPDATSARAKLDTLEGRAAIEEARRFRAVLSAAAKLQFPDVRFAPPNAEVRRNGRVGSLRWVGWVIAATVMGAVAIPSSAAYLQGRTLAQRAEMAQAKAKAAQEEYARGVEQWKSRVLAASAVQKSATTQYTAVTNDYLAALAKAETDLREKHFNVVVSGPAALTPGAPNYYQVETKNTAGQLAPAVLTARVVDQNRRVVYEPPAVESRGTYTLKLPVDLPLTPDRELSLEIDATAKEGSKAELKQKLSLAAPVYLSHLTTDKPLYQPGETVRFRALLLDRFKLEPPKEDLAMTLSVLDPSGAELVNITGVSPKPIAGLACGEYTLNPSAPGGEYTVRLRESTGRTPEQKRRFLVNKYQPARLEKKLEFTRKSYGPGDEVVAACNAARVSGPLANQPVIASAQVDGVRLPVEAAKTTDAKGAVLVKFRLPAQIERGAASVTVAFTDGGAQETLVKPVPVVLKKLVVEFYPEGGDLIAGVANRVYVQARTPLGKPAEMLGRVVDDKGAIVADVTTLSDDVEPGINQGQARFTITPVATAKYRLVVDKPDGITSEHVLPGAKSTGVVLNTGTGVTTDRDPLSLSITNAGPSRKLVVGAYARGRLLDHQRLTFAPNQNQAITLQATPGFGGITRVTVFEETGEGPARQLVPLAERLVFRQLTKKVELGVAADMVAYAPGDKASIKITAKDETGKAIPAIAMLGVVNQSVVVMADEKSFRSMPTHFLLTGEVEKAEDLEHIDVLLGSHAKAATALDLLLGVQGWRRFVEQGPEMPGVDRAEKIAIVAAPNVQTDSFQTAARAVVDERRPEFRKAQAGVEGANLELQAAMAAPADVTERNEQFRRAAVTAVRALIENYDFAAACREWLRSGLAFAVVFTSVVAVAAFGFGFLRRSGWLLRSAGAVTCAAVAMGLGWFSIYDHRDAITVSNQAASITPDNLVEDGDPAGYWGLTVDNNWTILNPENEMLGKLVVGKELKDAELRATLGRTLSRVHPGDDIHNAVNSIVGGFVDDYSVAGIPAASGQAFLGGGGGQFQGGAIGFGGGTGKASNRFGGGAPSYKPAAPPAPTAMPPTDIAAAPAARGAPGEKKPEAVVAAPKSAADTGGIRKGTTNDPAGRGGVPGRPARGREAAAGERTVAGQPNAAEPRAQDAAKKEVGLVLNKQLPEQNVNRVVDEVRRQLNDDRKAKDDKVHEIDAVALVRDPEFKPARLTHDFFLPEFTLALHGDLRGYRELQAGRSVPSFVVREYAHIHKPASDSIREDFAETVFWHPALVVPGEGLSVKFDLSDSVNRYQILAAAHTMDGRLGAAKSQLTARKPLTVEPKLPVEITAGDRIDVPVSVSNETDRPRDVKLSLESPGLSPVGELPSLNWSQPANSRSRRLFGFRPVHVEGMARLRLALAGEDAIEMKLPVVAEGFPVQNQIADELRGSVQHKLMLPQTWVPGTLKCEVALFPTPLADLQRGLDGLLHEPGGCFEQTSTTNYPNTLILDYLRETNQANPEAISRAIGMLDRGYNRLVSFEVPTGSKKEGYEWFGHAPAHEALTAYGLLQFRDMARVSDVDPAMIARTRQYLLARRDGHGGFQRSKAALDGFGRASESVTNAYIVWAITEGDKIDDVEKELDRLQRDSATSTDPYYLALVANALLNRDKNDAAAEILTRLVTMQHADGFLTGTTRSITGSQGGPLKIETTALAILGWLKANQPGSYGQATRKAVKWLGQQRQGQGSFGPTQSTILALKSLVAFAKANKQPPEAGTMELQIGDQVGTANYSADRQEVIVVEVPNIDHCLKPGENTVTLSTSGKNFYPYTIGWSYRTLQPPSAEGCAVKLTTQLDRSELAEGESTRLNVTLENVSKKGQGMAVAIIGLPAGLKLPDDFKQLRDLARVIDGKPGTIAFWELRGRDLVLYWRDLAPDAKVQLQLDVIANIPGQYRGSASRAYLYYDPAVKHWTPPLAATIAAK